MIKYKLVLVFLLVSSFTFCQKTRLIKNINFRAKELKHNLNKSKDSLLLEANRTIFSVNLFNKDHELTFKTKSKKASIPLHKLNLGRYVVEVVLYDKRIILTLLRDEPFDNFPLEEEIIVKEEETKPPKEIITEVIADDTEDIALDIKDKNPSINTENISDLLNYRREKIEKPKYKPKKKKTKYLYWVYSEINSGHFSKITKKMTTLENVERMIERNQLDIKTLKGQSNILIIWEVYDSRMFFKNRIMDKNYLDTESPYYNSRPYYTTESYGIKAPNN